MIIGKGQDRQRRRVKQSPSVRDLIIKIFKKICSYEPIEIFSKLFMVLTKIRHVIQLYLLKCFTLRSGY